MAWPKVSFMAFKEVTTSEIASLLRFCPVKSSAFDPIPTGLVRKLAYVLAAPIARLVNLSLSTGVFPDEMKLVQILPLLKKPSLDPELLCPSNHWHKTVRLHNTSFEVSSLAPHQPQNRF